jgi:hypothetical protein
MVSDGTIAEVALHEVLRIGWSRYGEDESERISGWWGEIELIAMPAFESGCWTVVARVRGPGNNNLRVVAERSERGADRALMHVLKQIHTVRRRLAGGHEKPSCDLGEELGGAHACDNCGWT